MSESFHQRQPPAGRCTSVLTLVWEYKGWLYLLHVNNSVVWHGTCPLLKELLFICALLRFPSFLPELVRAVIRQCTLLLLVFSFVTLTFLTSSFTFYVVLCIMAILTCWEPLVSYLQSKSADFLSKSGAQVVLNCHAAILSSWHFLRQDGRREVDERIVFILSCHLSETLYPFVNICLQTVLSHYPDTQRWHHTDSGTFQVLLRNITKKKKKDLCRTQAAKI